MCKIMLHIYVLKFILRSVCITQNKTEQKGILRVLQFEINFNKSVMQQKQVMSRRYSQLSFIKRTEGSIYLYISEENKSLRKREGNWKIRDLPHRKNQKKVKHEKE